MYALCEHSLAVTLHLIRPQWFSHIFFIATHNELFIRARILVPLETVFGPCVLVSGSNKRNRLLCIDLYILLAWLCVLESFDCEDSASSCGCSSSSSSSPPPLQPLQQYARHANGSRRYHFETQHRLGKMVDPFI